MQASSMDSRDSMKLIRFILFASAASKKRRKHDVPCVTRSDNSG